MGGRQYIPEQVEHRYSGGLTVMWDREKYNYWEGNPKGTVSYENYNDGTGVHFYDKDGNEIPKGGSMRRVMTWSVHGYDGDDGFPKRWSFYERHGDTYIPHCGAKGVCTNDEDEFARNCRRSLMEHSAMQRESYISRIVMKKGVARFYVSDFIQNGYASNETGPYRFCSCAGPDDEED